jgi:hypothetical protein
MMKHGQQNIKNGNIVSVSVKGRVAYLSAIWSKRSASQVRRAMAVDGWQ